MIPVFGNKVINIIVNEGWQETKHKDAYPWPAQVPGNVENCS
jgi:hypothetical protein